MRGPILGAAVLTLMVGAAGSASAQGNIRIFNNNLPGIGFNDPTPAAPVGGNPGTTLGAQRAHVFLHAAAIWRAKLQPRVDIDVVAQFTPLGLNVLGSAGAIQVWSDFPGAEIPGTWYSVALANHLSGVDLAPCPTPPVVTCFDINANFATTINFYMGLDNNEGPGQQDLLAVILHELGHGLGFQNFETETTGAFLAGVPDVYSKYTLDVTTNKVWTEMNATERVASAINVRKVSWNGINVKKAVPGVLVPGEPAVLVQSPASLGALMVGDASFGPPLNATGVTGDVVVALDAANGSGPLTTDGCTAITNGSEVAGRVALMDRGTCGFVVKAKNAQNAGAIAVLIADNALQLPPPGMAGVDPTITIPSVRISLPDANAIRAALPAVTVKLTVDTSILAGTDRVQGLMMLAAFNPVIGGSSISHFESIASPNQLMEPSINPDLTSAVDTPRDLTTKLFTDLGWYSDRDGVPDGVDNCIGSDIRETVIIGTCDSRAGNVVLADGCSISDVLARCPTDGNHGAYVSCVAHTANQLEAEGWITAAGKGAIQSCGARRK
jgi:hypothetical protein